MSKVLLVLGSLTLFFLALEGSSRLYLNSSQPQFDNHVPILSGEIWTFSDVEKLSTSQTRMGDIARIIKERGFRERIKDYQMTAADTALLLEAADYRSSEKGNGLYSRMYEVRPDLNDKFRVYGKDSGKLKYEAHYTTDNTGMRKGFPGKSKNILFVGCSYTFGQGVNDEETFPYLVGKKTGYRTFNKGIPGSGPLTILQNLKDQKEGYFRNIPPEETTVVLTLIPEQFPRVFNNLSFLRTTNLSVDYPYLSVEEDKIVLRKRYVDDPFMIQHLEYYLARLSFPIALGIEYPLVGEEEYILFARLLNEIQIEMKKNSPHVKNFAVALFPTGSARKLYKDLREVLLQDRNLTIFDYFPLQGGSLFGNSFNLKYDGHPSPVAYDLYSDLLIYDLKRTFGI